MAEDTEPRFFYGYVIVLAVFSIMVVAFGSWLSFGVFFTPMLTEFGWSKAVTSGAYSLATFVFGLLGIIMGRLSDRLDPRILSTACGFFFGLGHILMSQVSATWQLYLFYGVLIGTGMSGWWAPLVSLVARWFVKRRGLMIGLLASGVGIGTLIIPPLAGRLISSYDWRTAYIVIGLALLIVITAAAQFLRRDPSQMGLMPYGKETPEKQSLNQKVSSLSSGEAIRTWQFWMLSTTYFCFGFCHLSIMVHIVPHAIEIGVPFTRAADILAVIGALNIVGKIAIASVADRIGGKPAIIIALALLSIGLLLLLTAKEAWMLYLFAAIFGLAYGGLATLQPIMSAELFGLGSLGAVIGIVQFGYTLGAAVGPTVAGHIFDITASYQPAFIACVIMGITGLILASLLRPTISQGRINKSRKSI